MAKVTDKDRLVLFLNDNYDLVGCSMKVLCINLAKVNNGTFRNMNKPCPYTDLLDMWEQKINYLDKVYWTNVKRGKEMTGLQRLYYDLAILLNRYDKYLQHKENIKRTQEDRIAIKDTINYSQFGVTQNSQESSLNINDILGEI